MSQSTGQEPKTEIHTEGGAVIQGDVDVKGDFVNRDKNIFINLDTRHLALVIALLLVVGVGAAGYFLWPRDAALPSMAGDFNIAVAAFAQPNAGLSFNNRGRQLAAEVYAAMQQEITSTLQSGLVIEMRGPDQIEPIQGETAQARAEQAAALADQLDADLVIYGDLIIAQGQTTLLPEFYMRAQKVYKAEEAAGRYTFGDSLTVADNIDRNPVANQKLRELLVARARALAYFTVGLGYFAFNQYDAAAVAFADAYLQTGDDGKSQLPILLFLGTTATKRGDLLSARKYYQTALDLDDQYARAQLGLSQIDFLEARHECQPGSVDEAGLAAAEAGYERARSLPAPPLANMDVKIPLFLGSVYFCQSTAGLADRWQAARANFEQVIRRYEQSADTADTGSNIWLPTRPAGWRSTMPVTTPKHRSPWPTNFGTKRWPGARNSTNGRPIGQCRHGCILNAKSAPWRRRIWNRARRSMQSIERTIPSTMKSTLNFSEW